MILLFDLNGTLAQQRLQGRGWDLRPGSVLLSHLQNRGLRIGLFTNKTRRNIPLELFESIGVTFDFVFDQDDCEPAPYQSYSRQKSLSRHFPFETEAGTVRLVDDDPSKGLPEEQHLFLHLSKWDGDPDDEALFDLVRSLSLERKI